MDSPKFASQSVLYPYLNECYESTTAFCENQLTLEDTLTETGFYKLDNLHGWMKKLPHNMDYIFKVFDTGKHQTLFS